MSPWLSCVYIYIYVSIGLYNMSGFFFLFRASLLLIIIIVFWSEIQEFSESHNFFINYYLLHISKCHVDFEHGYYYY